MPKEREASFEQFISTLDRKLEHLCKVCNSGELVAVDDCVRQLLDDYAEDPDNPSVYKPVRHDWSERLHLDVPAPDWNSYELVELGLEYRSCKELYQVFLQAGTLLREGTTAHHKRKHSLKLRDTIADYLALRGFDVLDADPVTRERFCYEQWQAGWSYKEINAELKKHPGWEAYENERNVRSAIKA